MSIENQSSLHKITTRFGEVEYDPEKSIHFPNGLLGFESLHNFIVMPQKKKGPLFWIQSVDDPLFALVVTDPTDFFLEYRVIPEKNEWRTLGIQKDDEYCVLAVVTVPPDRRITLNLVAPILFAPQTKRAIQVVVDNSTHSVRTPLPEVTSKG
jgi:flagellar assembly factor FliW